MTFEYFCRKVEKAVQELLPELNITVQRIAKNNGVSFAGLILADEGSQTAAAVYLDSLYESYEKGATLAEVVRRILQTYEAGQGRRRMDLRFFTEYEQVKTRLSCRLINRERNRAHLETAPHLLLLDLALVPCCMLQGDDAGCACILIKNEHLKLWGIKEEDLMRDSLENMRKRFPAIVTSMDAFMRQNLCGVQEEQNLFLPAEENGTDREECRMMICTNHWHFYGAGAILTPGLLENQARRQQASLYILPSSVHEIILIPDTGYETARDLRGIVEEVNRCQVLEEEFLSDNVYYYDRREGRIRIL